MLSKKYKYLLFFKFIQTTKYVNKKAKYGRQPEKKK